MLRLTAVVSLTLMTLGGCDSADDILMGTYEQCLCRAELDTIVRLDDDTSRLALRFFRGKNYELMGKMIFDGDVQILGFDIWDNGTDPYPVHNLGLDDQVVKGDVNVPDFLFNVGFRGKFLPDYSALDVRVRHLGRVILKRVEKEPEEDTGF